MYKVSAQCLTSVGTHWAGLLLAKELGLYPGCGPMSEPPDPSPRVCLPLGALEEKGETEEGLGGEGLAGTQAGAACTLAARLPGAPSLPAHGLGF